MAVLVGFEDRHAILWRIFSRVAKPSARLELYGKRTDDKALYNFHESVFDSLKQVLKEGVRTIVITASVRTTHSREFLEHVKKHHRYLIQFKSPNRAIFVELVGSADDRTKVAELTKAKKFIELIAETASKEAASAAKKTEVKTRIVNAEIVADNRISQFGGIVFFSLSDQ